MAFRRGKEDREKGSAIVEATMAFPLIILALITVVYVLFFQYAKVAAASQVRMETLREAGRITGNYRTDAAAIPGVTVTDGYHLVRHVARGEKTVTLGRKGLLIRSRQSELEGRSYATDEKREIRMVDLFEDTMDTPSVETDP